MNEALTNDMVIPDPVRYVWDKAWVRPHESLWSVIRNFRIVNGKGSERDAYRIIGISYKNAKVQPYILYDTVSYADRSFTAEDYGILKNTLLPDGYIKEAEVLARCVIKNSLFLTNRLKYCPECMKNGYHSYLHQITGMDKCFIHRKTRLECDYSGSYAIGIPQKYDFDRFIPSYERVVANFRWGSEELSELQKSRYDSLPIEWDKSTVYTLRKSIKISDDPASMIDVVCPYANDRNVEGSFGKYLFMDKRSLASRMIYESDDMNCADESAKRRCSEILRRYGYDENYFEIRCLEYGGSVAGTAVDLVIRDFIGNLLKGIPLNKLICSEYVLSRTRKYDLSDPVMSRLLLTRLITGVVFATDIVDMRYASKKSIFPDSYDKNIHCNLRKLNFGGLNERYGMQSVMAIADHFLNELYKYCKRHFDIDPEYCIKSDQIAFFSNGLHSYVIEKEENGTVKVFAIES